MSRDQGQHHDNFSPAGGRSEGRTAAGLGCHRRNNGFDDRGVHGLEATALVGIGRIFEASGGPVHGEGMAPPFRDSWRSECSVSSFLCRSRKLVRFRKAQAWSTDAASRTGEEPVRRRA